MLFSQHIALHQAAGLLSTRDILTALDTQWTWRDHKCSTAWDMLIAPALLSISPKLAHIYHCVRAPAVVRADAVHGTAAEMARGCSSAVLQPGWQQNALCRQPQDHHLEALWS